MGNLIFFFHSKKLILWYRDGNNFNCRVFICLNSSRNFFNFFFFWSTCYGYFQKSLRYLWVTCMTLFQFFECSEIKIYPILTSHGFPNYKAFKAILISSSRCWRAEIKPTRYTSLINYSLIIYHWKYSKINTFIKIEEVCPC